MKPIKFLKRLFGLDNVLYERLENLMLYFQNVDVDGGKIHIIEKQLDSLYPFLLFEFKTVYGTVRITLFRFYDIDRKYTFDYVDYTGCYAFKIKTSQNRTLIKPLLVGDIKAKDIDLSIYELEQYLKTQYGNIQDILAKKEQDRKVHKQEVDKLVKGQIS